MSYNLIETHDNKNNKNLIETHDTKPNLWRILEILKIHAKGGSELEG